MNSYKTEDLVQKFKQNASSVVIFGCGLEGKLALHALQLHDVKVNYFIDSKKKLQDKYHLGIKTISPEELAQSTPDAHIFIAHQWLNVAIELLNKLNFKNIYNIVELLKSIDYSKEIHSDKLNLHHGSLKLERQIKIFNYRTAAELKKTEIKGKTKLNGTEKSNDTLVVSHIDIVVTERCSMKCRDCANLMQFYHKPKNVDINLLFKSMDRYMDCVDQLYEFRVIGGDPFMNKEMYKVINKAVEYKNVESVVIYTNAKIIPRGENLECLKNKKVILQITDYGSSAAANTWNYIGTRHDEIVKLLTSSNIKFVSERVTKWDDIGSLKFIQETPKQLQKKFNDCCANDLFSLLHGVLYKCPVSAHGTNLKAFSYDSKYDGVDLADDKISIKNLRKKLIDFYYNNNYLTACSYCKGRSYGEGVVDAAIQTPKALPLFS